MGGTSRKETGWFGDEYTEHRDANGNVTGRSTEETGWFGDRYTEHRDKDGNVIGRSTEETGWFGDRYTEHRDREGNTIGRSTEETGWFGDRYTEHRDKDGNAIGRSTEETGWVGDRYTQHHGGGHYMPAPDAAAERDPSSETDSSDSGGVDSGSAGPSDSGGYSGSETTSVRDVVRGLFALVVVVVIARGLWGQVKKIFSEPPYTLANIGDRTTPSSNPAGPGAGARASVQSVCGLGTAAPVVQLRAEWNTYTCMDAREAGPLWPTCLPWKSYTSSAESGCAGTQQCCPPLSSLPPTACGDVAMAPELELQAPWSSYGCRTAGADEAGCLKRRQYTNDSTRGCPGTELCCPPADATSTSHEPPARPAPQEAAVATSVEGNPPDLSSDPAEPRGNAPAATAEPPARLLPRNQLQPTTLSSTCKDNVESAERGFELKTGWCFYGLNTPRLSIPFTASFSARLSSGDGYGVWVGDWNDGRVSVIAAQYDLGFGGIRYVQYPDTEISTRPMTRVSLDKGWHRWKIEVSSSGLSIWLDDQQLVDRASTTSTQLGFRTWRGRVSVRDVLVSF